MRESNLVEFERLRERGRRYVYHSGEQIPAVRDIVIRYEADAHVAASAGVHSAGVILLGAAIEGLLLLRCLRSEQKSYRVASGLPRRLRPRFAKDPMTWTFETLIEVCFAAGWLPAVTTTEAKYYSAGLAHILRHMRNHVHPGKRARNKPWIEIDEREYDDAAAIYRLLLSSLGESRGMSKTKTEEAVLFQREAD